MNMKHAFRIKIKNVNLVIFYISIELQVIAVININSLSLQATRDYSLL